MINELKHLARRKVKRLMSDQVDLMKRHNKALAEMGVYYEKTFLAKRRELAIKVIDLEIEILKAIADED